VRTYYGERENALVKILEGTFDVVLKGIDYLFFNQGIKKTGFFNPADKNYLKFVYQNRDAQIYQVLKVN